MLTFKSKFVNLGILEEREEGEIEELLDDGGSYLKQWFKEVIRWKPWDVYRERLTWLRIYGIPCHAWNHSIF